MLFMKTSKEVIALLEYFTITRYVFVFTTHYTFTNMPHARQLAKGWKNDLLFSYTTSKFCPTIVITK